jgi:hypothetical protein
MLTGRLPFRGSLTQVLRQIASAEPVRPTALNMQIAGPLERICLKMMAKSPADRYPSMAAVVEALEETAPREAPKPAPRKSFWSGLWPFSRGKAEPPPPAVGPPLKTSIGPPDKTLAHESGGASSVEQTLAHESGEASAIEQTLAHESAEASAGPSDVESSNSKTIDLPESSEGSRDAG